MADTGIGRILTTKVISPIQGYDRSTGSLQEDVGYLGHERTLSVGQRVREKAGDEQKSAQSTTIVVIEQWICFVLGLVCMAFGMWGGVYEARTACSFCIHCMAGIAIYTDVTGNGSRVHRIGCNAGTPGMGASLTAFRFPAD
ncbi:MAG: hypothetical protein JWQ49_5747 [Edaphobacter sp.]|nr:hypothetical protein [Edaphobacter sp.]